MKQWLCLLVLVVSLMACTPEYNDFPPPPETVISGVETNAAALPTPLPTIPPAQTDTLLSALDDAEHQWQLMNLGDYRIVVTTISFWQLQTHTITIRFGEIAEATATCSPTPIQSGSCEVADFDPQTFTIAGLFAQANSLAQVDEGRYTEITFDPTYHFPNRISYNHPTILDEETIWRVDEFQPLR